MVDAKTTFMMWNCFYLFLETEPLWTFANLNRKDFIFYFKHVTLYIPNVLDLLTKVIIIHGWTHWISTWSINICMFKSWLVQYFEIEIM